MNPNFSEANEVAGQQLIAVALEQDAQNEFASSGFLECPLVGTGTLKRAVDVYHGPDGDGYVIRFIYELNEQSWCRCVARGPQAFRSHNWLKIPTL